MSTQSKQTIQNQQIALHTWIISTFRSTSHTVRFGEDGCSTSNLEVGVKSFFFKRSPVQYVLRQLICPECKTTSSRNNFPQAVTQDRFTKIKLQRMWIDG